MNNIIVNCEWVSAFNKAVITSDHAYLLTWLTHNYISYLCCYNLYHNESFTGLKLLQWHMQEREVV